MRRAQDDNQGAKVSIIGASGGIGQPLSLLMKMNNYVDSLSLYDRHHPPGVAVDLSHINTPCSVVGYRGESNLPTVLTGSDIVIITAGVPRKPGMNRDDLFVYNARVVSQLAEACSHYCPDAFILLLTNPINSLLPLFSEIYRRKGVDGSRRLFGVTILDSIRASTFVSGALHLPPDLCSVPVIGGHAGATIVPLLSQLRREEYEQLNVPVVTKRSQFGGDEVVAAKEGNGSATLSTAYAIATFTASLLHALDGERGVVEHAFIQQDYRNCHFFSSRVHLGRRGVEEPVPIPRDLSSFEEQLIDMALPQLKREARKGITFAREFFCLICCKKDLQWRMLPPREERLHEGLRP